MLPVCPILWYNIWVTFCSNSNTLLFDSEVYIWNTLSGVKFIVIVSPLPLKLMLTQKH